jgi:hypothetical protein
MIKQRKKPEVKTLEPEVMKIPISHNCPDKVLDLLVSQLHRDWGLGPGHKITMVLNNLLPENEGFIYDKKKLIQFRFRGGKFEFNDVALSSIRAAMVKNSAKS